MTTKEAIAFEKRFTIPVHMGLFDYTVRILFMEDQKKAFEYLQWKMQDPLLEPVENFKPLGVTIHNESTDSIPVILMPKKPKTADEWATLSHEACHAVNHLFRWAGIRHVRENEEVFAHAVGKIVSSV
jgi:hypothetical protein